MGKVTALKTASESERDELPPFDATITMNLSGERQIIIRSPVTEPLSRAEVDRRMDGLMRVAERQRSLIEVRVLTEDLASKRSALADVWLKRKAEAEEKHAAALKRLEDDVAQTETRRAELVEGFIKAERDRGKQGDIELTGNAKNREARMRQDIAGMADKVKTLEAEHLQHMQVIDGNIDKLENEIAAMERLLEKHQEIVG